MLVCRSLLLGICFVPAFFQVSSSQASSGVSFGSKEFCETRPKKVSFSDVPRVLEVERYIERNVPDEPSFPNSDFSNLSTEYLYHAILDGNDAFAATCIMNEANPDYVDRNGNSLLMIAIERNSYLIAKILVMGRANVNWVDDQGYTPILRTAGNGNLKGFLWLKNHGADLHVRDKRERTALHLATASGNSDVVHHLIQAGLRADEKDEDGWTPLYLAARKGDLPMVQLLSKALGATSYQNEWGLSPLKIAHNANHLDVVKSLQDSYMDELFGEDEDR